MRETLDLLQGLALTQFWEWVGQSMSGCRANMCRPEVNGASTWEGSCMWSGGEPWRTGAQRLS